jgi:DNA repair protein RadD
VIKMNIWRAWSSREFQELIDTHYPGLLSRLEYILPGLLGEEFLIDSLYTGESLQKIVEAFLPSDAFSSKEFRKECLNKLRPDELKNAASHTAIGYRGDFSSTRDAIANYPWKGDFTESFVDFFDLPEHFLPAPDVNKPNSIDILPATKDNPIEIHSPFMQLIDYQYGVYSEAISSLEQPRARMVIQMPTGSGKTRTAMEIVSKIMNSEKEINIVWLAHTRELCEQGLQCFKQVWPHHAKKKVRIHRCWGKHPLSLPVSGSSNIFFAGFDKLNAALKKDQSCLESISKDCRLIVVDEAHKTEAPTYKNAILSLLGEDTAVVGLTATPGRTYKEETESLANFYFNQLIELPDTHGDGVIAMLRNRGVLSKADYRAIMTEIDVPLTNADKKYMEEKYKIPPKIIKMLANEDQRNLEILQRLRAEIKKEGRRVLLFGCSVEHSRFLNSCLLYLGLNTGHVDGSTNLARRAMLIDDFRNGNLDVLCNYGVLTTGFDAPKTNTIMITRPTISPVLYSQMIGRGLRGTLIGGTEFCKIIDVRDNIGEFGDADSVYRIFQDYWVN